MLRVILFCHNCAILLFAKICDVEIGCITFYSHQLHADSIFAFVRQSLSWINSRKVFSLSDRNAHGLEHNMITCFRPLLRHAALAEIKRYRPSQQNVAAFVVNN